MFLQFGTPRQCTRARGLHQGPAPPVHCIVAFLDVWARRQDPVATLRAENEAIRSRNAQLERLLHPPAPIATPAVISVVPLPIGVTGKTERVGEMAAHSKAVVTCTQLPLSDEVRACVPPAASRCDCLFAQEYESMGVFLRVIAPHVELLRCVPILPTPPQSCAPVAARGRRAVGLALV